MWRFWNWKHPNEFNIIPGARFRFWLCYILCQTRARVKLGPAFGTSTLFSDPGHPYPHSSVMNMQSVLRKIYKCWRVTTDDPVLSKSKNNMYVVRLAGWLAGLCNPRPYPPPHPDVDLTLPANTARLTSANSTISNKRVINYMIASLSVCGSFFSEYILFEWFTYEFPFRFRGVFRASPSGIGQWLVLVAGCGLAKAVTIRNN